MWSNIGTKPLQVRVGTHLWIYLGTVRKEAQRGNWCSLGVAGLCRAKEWGQGGSRADRWIVSGGNKGQPHRRGRSLEKLPLKEHETGGRWEHQMTQDHCTEHISAKITVRRVGKRILRGGTKEGGRGEQEASLRNSPWLITNSQLECWWWCQLLLNKARLTFPTWTQVIILTAFWSSLVDIAHGL